jgi:glycosyltransferase involved in cell wall biosynthesis
LEKPHDPSSFEIMTNVAFLFTGVTDLSGGGGAERFFSDFFEDYQKAIPAYNLFFISDRTSLESFNTIGNLKNEKNILTYKIINNRFKDRLEAFQFVRLVVKYKIKLVQVPLYNVHYYPILKAIDSLPKSVRPKIVFTVTDSFIPYYYFNDDNRGYNYEKVFSSLFNSIKIDSVISWYKLFTEFVSEHQLIKSKPKLFYITSRYSAKLFNDAKPKKNNMVYAGRLTLAKRPMMFVEAIRILKQRNVLPDSWRFFMYGKGNLENEVTNKIAEYGLTNVITLSHGIDLTPVFEESKCFVSTQDYENFPSLSMNEAMMAGNAIIARNVGQTGLFVKDGVNGILLKEDTEKGLAAAIEYYLSHPEMHETMGAESLKLTREVHTFQNFKAQIESFWQQTLN